MLEQFSDPNALALMYLAGELNEEDQAEVERLLATDRDLRREVDRLRSIQMQVEGVLARWDQASPTAMSQEVAVRQVSRTMARWLVEGRAQPDKEVAQPALHLLRWAYPLAAAAMITLTCGLWLHHLQVAQMQRSAPISSPVRLADRSDNSKEQQEKALAESLFASDSARSVELTQDLHPTGDLFGDAW
jgi:anti-sigma factor RsiW